MPGYRRPNKNMKRGEAAGYSRILAALPPKYAHFFG